MSPEVKSEIISCENSTAQHTRGCQISLFICEDFDWMDGRQAIDLMLTKFSATNTGRVLCGFEENDLRRKTKLNDLQNKIWRYIGYSCFQCKCGKLYLQWSLFSSLKTFELGLTYMKPVEKLQGRSSSHISASRCRSGLKNHQTFPTLWHERGDNLRKSNPFFILTRRQLDFFSSTATWLSWLDRSWQGQRDSFGALSFAFMVDQLYKY